MQKIMEKKRGMKTRVQEEAIKGASNKKTPKKSESCLFYHGMWEALWMDSKRREAKEHQTHRASVHYI